MQMSRMMRSGVGRPMEEVATLPCLYRRNLTKHGRLSSYQGQGGATLLILMLILGMGAASFFLANMKSSRVTVKHQRQTQVMLSQAREALLGFALRNGRLPRPAISALDGREAQVVCNGDADCTGFLPWVALGLTETDASGFRLRYSVSADFTASPVDFSKAVATKTIQVRTSAGLNYLFGQSTCTRSAQCLPAVIWSTGERNFGVTVTGQHYTSNAGDNLDERNNDRATTNWILRPITSADRLAGGEFDDQLVGVPLLTLINRITAGYPGPG